MTRSIRPWLFVALLVGVAIIWSARDAAAQKGFVSIDCTQRLVVAQGPSVLFACGVLPLNGYQGSPTFSCGPAPESNQQTPAEDVHCVLWSPPRLDPQKPSRAVFQMSVGGAKKPGFWLNVTAHDPQQPQLGQSLGTAWVDVAPIRAVAMIRAGCSAPLAQLQALFRPDKKTGTQVLAGTDPNAFTYDLRLESLDDLTDVSATIEPTTAVSQSKVQSLLPLRLQGGNAIQVFDQDPCTNGQNVSQTASIVVKDSAGGAMDWKGAGTAVVPASIEVHASMPVSRVVWVRIKARPALSGSPGWSDDEAKQFYQLQDVQATLRTAGGSACNGKCELTGALHAPIKLSSERPTILTVPMKPLRFSLETSDGSEKSDYALFGTLSVAVLGDERVIGGYGRTPAPLDDIVLRAGALDLTTGSSPEVLGDDFVLRLVGAGTHPFVTAPGALVEGEGQDNRDGVFSVAPCADCEFYRSTEAWLGVNLPLELVTAGGRTYHTHTAVHVACRRVAQVPLTAPVECGVRTDTRFLFYAEDDSPAGFSITMSGSDSVLGLQPPPHLPGDVPAGSIAMCGISRFDYLGSPSAKRVAGAACLLLPLAVLAALRRRERRRAARSSSARD